MRTRSSRHRGHRAGRFGAGASLGVLLVLGGCGDDGTGTATDADPPEQTTSSTTPDGTHATATEVPDLCTLLGSDDFESATGAPAGGEPVSTPAVGAVRGSCTWSAEAGFPTLLVGAYNETDREATLEVVESEPVDGLGTEADWAEQTGVLMVVDGQDWYLQVFVMGTDDDKAAAIEAAGIVLGNLD